MLKKHSVAMVVVLLLSVMIAGCTGRVVTLRGEEVTDKFHQTAALAIDNSETLAVSVLLFLQRGVETGAVSREALVVYAADFAPRIQQALDTARTALTSSIDNRAKGATELQEALNVALAVIQDAVVYASDLGFN